MPRFVGDANCQEFYECEINCAPDVSTLFRGVAPVLIAVSQTLRSSAIANFCDIFYTGFPRRELQSCLPCHD